MTASGSQPPPLPRCHSLPKCFPLLICLLPRLLLGRDLSFSIALIMLLNQCLPFSLMSLPLRSPLWVHQPSLCSRQRAPEFLGDPRWFVRCQEDRLLYIMRRLSRALKQRANSIRDWCQQIWLTWGCLSSLQARLSLNYLVLISISHIPQQLFQRI